MEAKTLYNVKDIIYVAGNGWYVRYVKSDEDGKPIVDEYGNEIIKVKKVKTMAIPVTNVTNVESEY